jgi:probable aminopeptidase NPEPL1
MHNVLRAHSPKLSAPFRRTLATAMAAHAAAQELRFTAGAPPVDAETLVVVGTMERLLSPAVAALLPESVVPRGVWEAMVGAAKGDFGGSNTTWLPPASDGAKPRKLTAAVLPSSCSRHNSPAQPHAITSLVGSAIGSGGSASVALVVPREHALASACAVARCLHLYSAKSGGKEDPTEPTDGASASPPVITCGLVDGGSSGAGGDDDAAAAAASVGSLLSLLSAAADAVRFAARLVDTPPAEMTTTHFRAEARETARLLGERVTYTEVVGEALRDRGFGGIWGVGKAAEEPPALVVLSYTPPGGNGAEGESFSAAAAVAAAEEKEPLGPAVLVGKGIIYDTGGLSLKISGSMVGMKMDCGGAAAMLGAFKAAVLAGGLRRTLHCVLCLAENAIGPGAFRNDDILRMYALRECVRACMRACVRAVQ